MTVHDELARIVELQKRAPATDAEILGAALQRQDAGASYLAARTYSWWWALGAAARPCAVVEIGVRFGYSLLALLKGGGRSANQVMVAGFDNECNPGDANPLQRADAHLADWADERLFQKVDTQTLAVLPGLVGVADLAIVDADHSEAGAYHDCGLAWAALAPGGLLVVDDTGGPAWPENPVRRAAERFLLDRGVRDWGVVPSFTGFHIARKPE